MSNQATANMVNEFNQANQLANQATPNLANPNQVYNPADAVLHASDFVRYSIINWGALDARHAYDLRHSFACFEQNRRDGEMHRANVAAQTLSGPMTVYLGEKTGLRIERPEPNDANFGTGETFVHRPKPKRVVGKLAAKPGYVSQGVPSEAPATGNMGGNTAYNLNGFDANGFLWEDPEVPEGKEMPMTMDEISQQTSSKAAWGPVPDFLKTKEEKEAEAIEEMIKAPKVKRPEPTVAQLKAQREECEVFEDIFMGADSDNEDSDMEDAEDDDEEMVEDEDEDMEEEEWRL